MDSELRALLSLAEELDFPAPVLAPLREAAEQLPPLPLDGLAGPATAGDAWAEADALLPPWQEDHGMARLAAVLAAALRTRALYRAMHIPDSIYLATMRCLPRFLRETKEITGAWDFDRGFWTWRQTGGLLYRLGTLEFEYKSLGNSPAPPGLSPEDGILSVHIPSDASLSREELDRSYACAAEFFASTGSFCCLAGPPKAVLCGSWLLSPALDGLLPQSSGIRRFAGDYERYYVREEDASFYRWLFGAKRPVEELPEDTGLRRAVKRCLLAGGLVGMACGELKNSGRKTGAGHKTAMINEAEALSFKL